jgi:hypothetical protein
VNAAFLNLLNRAEGAVSDALKVCPVTGNTQLEVAEAELMREALSLARTLVTSAKLVLSGGVVNRKGFVQGKGSEVDVLCAEVCVRRGAHD